MVTGIESFRDWFRGCEHQYTIIGGTACSLLMTDVFRLTELLDPTSSIKVPKKVFADMQMFTERMRSETIDLKQLGLIGRTKEDVLDELKKLYLPQNTSTEATP